MAKRWVIKLGSGLLTRKDGKVDRVQIGRIVDQVAGLHKRGIQVVLVTSGAVAAGMTAMALEKRPKEARELQACATVGQPELMSEYGKHLRRHKLLGAQMLLTYWDLDSRACTRNARATIDLLLARKRFIPIINENDAIADEEIKVGDNDRLSAHVAALVGADLLIILSGIPGLMTKSDGSGDLIPPSARSTTLCVPSPVAPVPNATSAAWSRSCSPRRSRPKAASTRLSPAVAAKASCSNSPRARSSARASR